MASVPWGLARRQVLGLSPRGSVRVHYNRHRVPAPTDTEAPGNTVVLDGASFTDQEGLHAMLKDKLALPAYYGANLNALWDCLTGWIEVPVKIIWKDYAASKRALGHYAERTLETLREAEAEDDGIVVEVQL